MVRVEGLCPCCPTIVLAVPDDARVANVRDTVPIEAEGPGDDGAIVHVLLHVQGGRMRELELFREDGTPPSRIPALDKLTVPFVPWEGQL